VGFHPKGLGEDTIIVRTRTNIQKSCGPVGIASGRRSYKCFVSLGIKMGPVLATEGKLRQIATNTTSLQCVEANGAGVVASNDGKRTNDGVF